MIGAGNGGLTAAYHLTKLGHTVCLYDSPEFDAQIHAIREAGGIRALEGREGDSYLIPGFETPALLTTTMQEAVEFGDLLVMICPSFAQELLFEKMLPFLKEGQTLLSMPGNFAGLVLKNRLDHSARAGLSIAFADAISIPWATRILAPAKIAVMGLKTCLPLSIFPKELDTKARRALIEEALPIPAEFLQNPLQAGLENINFGGHPLMTTVNIGLLENFDGNFTYYADCCSPSTAKAAAKMDLERLAVGAAYGIPLRTELEAMNLLYASDCRTVYEFNRGSVTHGKVKDAPSSARARYITEDVPYLLVPIWHLAKKAGLNPVIMESIIHLAGAYNDTDYFTEGRTLEKMGLSELSAQEIKERFL